MSLTDKRIQSLKPQTGAEYVEADNGPGGRKGLQLVVSPNGRKYFRARVKQDGKTVKHPFVPDFPELKLQAAREAFDEFRKSHHHGRRTVINAHRSTVRELFARWNEEFLQDARVTADATVRSFEKDVLPVVGDVQVADVTRLDLAAVVKPVRVDRQSPRQAEVLTAELKQFFDFAITEGLIENSPARLLQTGKPGKKKRRKQERHLDDEEIRKFWAATAPDRDEVPAQYLTSYWPRVTPDTKRVLRLLLLTGTRRSQIVEGKWDEIDVNARTWTIPVERTKTPLSEQADAHPFVVPLSDFALQIIEEQRLVTGAYTYVFGSPKAEPAFSRPLWPSAITQAVKDNFHTIVGVDGRRKGETAAAYSARTKLVQIKPHHLRHTLRTRLSQLGVNRIVARVVVGHSLEGIDDTYDHYDYFPEKRESLDKWAVELRAILDGADRKVVPFRRAG